MARGSKVVLNRSRLDQVTLAVADGLFAVGKQIIDTARPADSPYEPFPTGEGLPLQGGVLAYVNGKKVAGYGLDGRQPRAPRAARVSRGRGVEVIVGWGFPARFNEFGTVKMAAQPFFTPAELAVLPQTNAILAEVTGPKLKGIS
jgi:HK97 gp10 family phage protein